MRHLILALIPLLSACAMAGTYPCNDAIEAEIAGSRGNAVSYEDAQARIRMIEHDIATLRYTEIDMHQLMRRQRAYEHDLQRERCGLTHFQPEAPPAIRKQADVPAVLKDGDPNLDSVNE